MAISLTQITNYLLSQSWQIAILVLVIALINYLLRNKSAHIRYLLWLIIIAKCLVPPFYIITLAILPQQSNAELTSISQYTGKVSPKITVEDTIMSESSQLSLSPPEVKSAPGIEQVRTVIDYKRWFGISWLIGVCLFLIYNLLRALRANLWFLKYRKALPVNLLNNIKKSFSASSISKFPMVWLVEGFNQPFVWGLLRGSIYLPVDFLNSNSPEHQKSVLCHEISHVLRYDAAVNILQIIAQTVFWFNPFVWWSNHKIRQEREKCCDEMAIAQLNTKPRDYSTAILETLAARNQQTRSVPTLAVAGPVKNIEERIKTMLRPGKKFYKKVNFKVAVTVLLFASLIIPTTLVFTAKGQSQTTTSSSEKTINENSNIGQPRYAARTFNSQIAFSVSVIEADGQEFKEIGNTPSETPLQIFPCWLWKVKPIGRVDDWGPLAREMSLNKIPGLTLDFCTDSNLKDLGDLKDLRWLDLINTSITDAGLEYLKGMTELEVLYLNGTRITGAGMVNFKNLKKLRWLELAKTSITDAGLEYLKGLTELEVLYLNGTKITDAGIFNLKDLTGLRQLKLINTSVTDVGLENLRDLNQLELLDLRGRPVTNAGLVNIQPLKKNLQQLWLENTRIGDAGLEYLQGFEKLKQLLLDRTLIGDAGLEHIKNLTSITELSLRDTHVTDAGLEHLKGLKNLQQLWLDNTRVGDVGLEHLKGLNSLVALSLRGTQTTDTGIEYLQNLKGLQQLWIDSTQIGDEGLKYLQNLKELKQLWLDNTQVGDTGLEYIKNLNDLQRLSLVNTHITDDGLEHLKGLTKLERLFLTRTGITDAGLKNLQDLTILQILGLNETKITDAGVNQLKQHLPNIDIQRDLPQTTTQDANKPIQQVVTDGTLVFEDNFDNGLSSRWQFQNQQVPRGAPSPEHTVENGQLMLRHSRALLNIGNLTNYVVRARFCIKQMVTGGFFSIQLRAWQSLLGSNRSDYYHLYLSPEMPALILQFSYYDASNVGHTDFLGGAPYKLVLDQWYTIEIEVRGEKLRVYLDGKLMMEVTDNHLKRGATWFTSHQSRAFIDDVSVYSLP